MKLIFPGAKQHGTSVAKTGRMEKLKMVGYLTLTLITLAFGGCATQPTSTTSSDTTGSPLERSKGNGLASYMH